MAIYVNPSTGKMQTVESGATAPTGFVSLDTYTPGQATAPVAAPAAPTAPVVTTTPTQVNQPVVTPAVTSNTTSNPVQSQPTVVNKQNLLTNIQEAANTRSNAKANEAFIQGVAQYALGRKASPDELGVFGTTKYGLTGATVQQVIDRFGIGDKIKGFNIQEPVKTEETAIAEQPIIKNALEQKTDLIESYLGSKDAIRTEAKNKAGVAGIEANLNNAGEITNQLMQKVEQMTSDLELKDILNEETQIALKDKIEGRVIPMSMINRQLTSDMGKLTQEQRVSRLYDVYSLNTMINAQNAATRTTQLIQGQYDRAMDNVKQSVDDWSEYQNLKLDLLTEMGQLEKEEKAKLESEIQYERSPMEQGYTHVQDTDTYNKIVKDLGVTASTFSQFFYKDPSNGKIYLKPSEPQEDPMLSISEAASLGVKYGTTVSQAAAMGIDPYKIAQSRKTSGGGGSSPKPKSYIKDANKLIGAGLTEEDIANINTNLANNYSLDDIISSSNLSEDQAKALRGQFVEEPAQGISAEDASVIISSAVDKEGNLDITKIPSEQRLEVLKAGRDAGLFDEDDEDTQNWLEKAWDNITFWN